jgi:S-DNA-T family DNA segregation ATPase FtsK/SpoIIIE
MLDQPAGDDPGASDSHDAELVPAPPRDVAEVVDPVETVDGEIVDEAASGPPVDQPRRHDDDPVLTRVTAAQGVRRRPIVPAWVANADDRAATARWAAIHVGHHAAYHGVRLPHYGAKLALRTPVGIVRFAGRAGAWVFDLEAHGLRQHAIRANDPSTYQTLVRMRNDRVRARLILAGVLLATLAALCVALAILAPWWAQALATAGAIVTFGLLGAPSDRPLLSPAVIVFQAPRLTSEMVHRALTSIGAAGLTGKVHVTFPAPITRDGPGWRADVDLPHGVTVTQILSRREELASGLRRPLGCVWPGRDPEAHAGRLILWVGDQDLRKARQQAWPLAKRGVANVFEPIPFGTDQRGRVIPLTLMFANLLLGAMPRQGKTTTLRIVLLGLALDPWVELRVFELKGTGDLSPLEPVCHHYASGGGNEAIEQTMTSLRDLHSQLQPRAKKISELARRNRTAVPDNKITPEMARQRSLGLWPVVFAVDECQQLFSDKDYGAEAADLCTDLIKIGPALGIMLILATQRPDKDSLPKAISDNVALRFCLYVEGQPANDMVLGTSAYKNGHRATTFTPILDAGIGILKGAAPEPQVVRAFYTSGKDAELIAERARQLRDQAGTLTGHAIGEALEAEDWNILDDIADALQPGEDALWSEVLLARLAAARPQIYGPWKPAALAAALKPYGLEPGQVWGLDGPTGQGRNRRGYTADAIAEAISSRMLPAANRPPT